MSNGTENFLVLCRCLSADASPPAFAGLRAEISSGRIDWEGVVALANRHFVTPALWVSFREKGLSDCIPGDLADFLRNVHRLNVARNEKIREQAREIVVGLNTADIEPIILKGGVHLFENTFGDLGALMMLDLDFLVPGEKIDSSVAALSALGYEVQGEGEEWTYHYLPLSRPGGAATVDLHRDVGEQRDVLKADFAFREAVRLKANGLRLSALAPTHRVVHNIFHAQIQNRRHEIGIIPLKDLHYLVAICTRHSDAIVWADVRQTFEGHGLRKALDSCLYLANRLLGLPQPPEVPQTFRARLHYRRCLAQIRWKGLTSLAGRWATATHPFKRYNIDYIYRCGTNPFRLNLYRIRHAWKFLKKYKWKIFEKLKVTRKTFYDFG